MDLANTQSELLAMLIEKSVCRGTFTLASGATSDLYVDCRQTTMDPHGAILVGRVGWGVIRRQLAEQNLPPIDSLGGLTMGADPIALSIGIAAHLEDPQCTLGMFTVRKSAKAHGRGKLIEGVFKEGDRVVIIDDVITTGGSTLQAIDAVEAAGGKVQFVLVLVDRQEGGRNNIEARGHPVVPIFTRADVT
jgi:orotate phosphoribosyltransferase